MKLPLVDISGWDTTPPPGWNEPRWNGWRLDGYELRYPAYPSGGAYPIDIVRFTSSPQMLNMIMQVSRKTWATDKCVAGLVHALNDILQPQAHLCSMGIDTRLTVADIRRMVDRGGS